MEIRINKAILHILDNNSPQPVFSQSELELNEGIANYIARHIEKLITDDGTRDASLFQDSPFHAFAESIQDGENFLGVSIDIAQRLHKIMVSNITIPNADLLVAMVTIDAQEYLALIKFNYKEGYTHFVNYNEQGIDNQIITHKVLFASESQKNDEGALIRFEDKSVKVAEKPYEINGEKTFYFSKMFLGCSTHYSQKESLKIVNTVAARIGKKYFDDSFETASRVKTVLHELVEDDNEIDVEKVAHSVFESKPEIKEEYISEIKQAGVPERIRITSQKAENRLSKHKIKTDNGIELSIPMELYKNKDVVEFITNYDGTTSLIIKNIQRFISK